MKMASSLLDFIVRTQLNSAVVIRQPYLAALYGCMLSGV